MPALDAFDPDILEALRDVVRVEKPGFELVGVEGFGESIQSPDAGGFRMSPEDSTQSQSIDELQEHYARLGFARRSEPIGPRPDPGHGAGEDDLYSCLVRSRESPNRSAPLIGIIIALGDRTIMATQTSSFT